MGPYTPTQEDIDNPCKTCGAVYDGKKAMQRCSSCANWFHEKCANEIFKKGVSFYCIACKEKASQTGTVSKPVNITGGVSKNKSEIDDGTKTKDQQLLIEELKKTIARQEALMEELRQKVNKKDKKTVRDKMSTTQKQGEDKEDEIELDENNSDEESSSGDSKFKLKYKKSASKGKVIEHKGLKNYVNYSDSSTSDDTSSSDSDEEMCKPNRKKSSKKQFNLYVAQQEMRELPTFDGNPAQWCSFYRTYIETKSFFSDVANRNRLQKALKGKALKTVSGLLLSPSTIADAVKMLKFRFGQTEHIIQDAIDQALSTEPPNESTPESIIDYAMMVLTIKANVEAVGDKTELMNPMLIKSLAHRLPYTLQRKWNRRKRELRGKGRLVKLTTFSRWLLNESRDYVDLVSVRPKDGKRSGRKDNINVHYEKDKYEQNKDEQVKLICFKCSNDNHHISECQEFKAMPIEKRIEFARFNRLCFVCLKRGHRWRRCFKKSATGQKTFHKLLQYSKSGDTMKGSMESQIAQLSTNTTLSHHQKNISTLFKIVPVILHGPVSQIHTYALIDECASSSLIEEDIAKKLMLKGPSVPLLMGWTKDITNLEKNSMKVRLFISGTDINAKKYFMKNVSTVQKLSLPSQSVDVSKIKRQYPYLEQVKLNVLKRAVPTILIGLDNTNLIAAIETKRDPGEEGPVATLTKLGWTIHGPEMHMNDANEVNHTFLHCECYEVEDQKISTLMEQYFSVEDIGVKIPMVKPESIENKRASKILVETTKRMKNGFVTGLLWRRDGVHMPDNYDMCLRRLVSIEMKMKKNTSFKKEYCAKIREYVDKGYAQKLTEDECAAIQSNMWLLPHFGTSTLNKPKLRLVFDAKAMYNGVSLNSELLNGPDQYNNLVGVLYKFRQGRVAVAADIKDMFHRISIREEDQPFQCFLWRDNDSSRRPDVYIMKVMIFGAKCSPCSAQYVRNRNALDFANQKPLAATAISRNFYVDDYMESFDSDKEALEITKDVIEINSKANFELRHVISNSELLRSELGDKNDHEVVNLNKVANDLPLERVLGLFWDVISDDLMFKPNLRRVDNVNTNQTFKTYSKREILKILMSVFDPLGFLCHYTIRAKLILQEVWMRKDIDWETLLPDDLNERWLNWYNNLERVTELRIPRNYSPSLLRCEQVHLHVFTDASERAFSAVAYIRIETNNEIEVKLVSGKSKVSSQKSSRILSMPRQELQGALLGVRLAAFIAKEHSIQFETTTFWTDSQTVLSWIRTEFGCYKQFVAHRISEILESTKASQWRYVPSKMNPADDATKVTKNDPFDINCPWFCGPTFLRNSNQGWPIEESNFKIGTNDPEIRRIYLTKEQHNIIMMSCHRNYEPINPDDFSNWHKLLRITAWAKRGIYNFNFRVKGQPINQNPLSLNEIREAEMYLIKKAQLESYPNEIKSLLNHQPVSHKSKILNLLPFLDECGVLRMQSRIERSPQISIDMKKPIILDRLHRVTRLILQSFHEKYQHQFQETIVNEVRTRFWIPQLRIAIKQCKKRCQVCKNEQVLPMPPQMSKLPLARVDGIVGCFQYCGVDLFGPIYVSVRRSREKRWCVLYTCLTTRAIYLDLVSDLSADSFIMSVRNCNSRRGPIRDMFCDCGTNMVGARRELKTALDDVKTEQLQRECLKLNINWHFNPPASPHMGGCWERMVRSVKNVLLKLMKEKHPKENTLRSLLCEVEEIVNMRPLTYIALEQDNDDVLTPKHFLNPFFRHYPPPPGEFNEHDLMSKKQWRFVQQLANHFWRKWLAEYLPMITRTTKWHDKQISLKIGDLVIICDNTAPRNCWEKGRIIEVRTSDDGQVRSAMVKTQHGVLHRPAIKLAKLDVEQREAVNPEDFTKASVDI